VISKLSSLVPRWRVRAGLAAIAVALVLVPTLARARQQVERRDATRLSIKHSWVGVAPPPKASIAPVQVAVLPPPVVMIDRPRVISRVAIWWSAAPRAVYHDVSDPLRGPPSARS